MHAAVICGHTEIAVELQRLGADPYQEDDVSVRLVPNFLVVVPLRFFSMSLSSERRECR